METTFSQALAHTLRWEGAYINDPDDPGGETKFGISKRSYPDLDIKNLSRQHAEKIYLRDYWESPGFDKVADAQLAVKLFDLGVNLGPSRASRMLQSAANLFEAGLAVDGVVGPKTLGFVNGFRHPKALTAALKIMAGNHYIRQDKPRFLAGWLNRLDS